MVISEPLVGRFLTRNVTTGFVRIDSVKLKSGVFLCVRFGVELFVAAVCGWGLEMFVEVWLSVLRVEESRGVICYFIILSLSVLFSYFERIEFDDLFE